MWREFVSLFFPECCAGCNRPLLKHENTICLHCLEKLPHTNFSSEPQNEVEKVFWGRVPVESAASLMFFNKRGIAQRLLHRLKYDGQTNVGFELGRLAAKELRKTNRFEGVDLIIPVPMHRRKLKKRGFNQCTFIAQGISDVTGVPVNEKLLVKESHTASQTRKSKIERWFNVETIFAVSNPGELEGKHVLLIDDVLTTGATLESAAQTLLKYKNVRVSIYTLAFTVK